MTTMPAPTSTIPTLILDEDTYIGYTADEVNRLIGKAHSIEATRDFVQQAKAGEGTGTLGLYVEAVAHTAAGAAFTHMKFFVVGCYVYAYSRTVGDARANWRRREAPTLQAALATVQSALNRPNVKLFGHPVLVELTADDLSAIEEGGMPPARFRGEYRIQKQFGRYDFEMPVVSKPVTQLAALLGLRNRSFK